MTPSLDSLLAELADRNWRVNNLFQLRDGSWQANLFSNLRVTDFAYGFTAVEALSLAIDKIENSRLHVLTAQFTTYSIQPANEPAIDLSRFTSRLTAAEPIKRRI